MAHSRSAQKRIKIAERNRIINKSLKSRYKTRVKNVEHLLVANNIEDAKVALQLAQKDIDKAASRGAIHKNKAARQKSKIARSLNKALQK